MWDWDTRRPQRQSTEPTLVRVCSIYLLSNLRTMDIDKKCPFTSEVSIRGRILTGRVVSTKMTRTIIIRRDYLHYIPKYSACGCITLNTAAEHSLADRYEKRHKNLAAHVSPAFRVELGDVVTVGQL